MKPFISLLLALLYAFPASAETRLGQSALDVLQALRARGIESVGAFNIRKVEREAAKIRWEYSRGGKTPSFAGSRKSAYYQVGPKKVVVSEHLPAFAANFYPSLELHETLGALGYRDHNYAQSMALRLLAETEDPALRARLKKTFGKTIFSRSALRDGGSSVGSGGDLIGLSAKSLLLDGILAREAEVTAEFLEFFPKLNFEPDYKSRKKYFEVEYTVESRVRGPAPDVILMTDPRVYYEESITVFIPAKRWGASAADRQALLKEMNEMIVGIFPASPHYRAKIKKVRGCDNTISVAFPETKSYQARAVQQWRVGLRPDCKKRFGFGNRVSMRFH